MRLLFAVLLLLQLSVKGLSQGTSLPSKPPVDTSVLDKWPELFPLEAGLSDDGKYVTYVLKEHMPTDQITTVVQTPDAKWKKELKGVSGVKFTADSRSALYLSHDTLYTVKLGGQQVSITESVQSYKLVPYGKSEWIVYQLKSPGKELVIQDEKTGKQSRFTAVENYTFSKDGEDLVLQGNSEERTESRLRWVDLATDKETVFWQGSAKFLQLIFNEEGSQLAFTTESTGKRSVWHYTKGSSNAEQVLSDGSTGIDSGLFIGSLDRFSKDGERVFFYLEKREQIKPLKPDAANVNIWRYNDNMLQPQQLQRLAGKKEVVKKYLSVVNVKSRNLIRLQENYCLVQDRSENYTLINRLNTDQDLEIGTGEADWNPAKTESSYYLVSNTDGGKIKLPWLFKEIYAPHFSPNGRFIYYRPYFQLHYFTYEVATGTIRNMTSEIKTDLTLDNCYKNIPSRFRLLLDIPGWLKGDSGVLIYDRNDIWLVDPLAKRSPECITNGYGKRTGLILRFAKARTENIISPAQKLLLAAFNKNTKENGHFIKTLGQKGDPLLLNIQGPLYAVGAEEGAEIHPKIPTKALNKEVYLVNEETSSTFPNLYYSNGLKHFQQITFLAPEKKFNWLTSALHSWVAPDGDTLQGILYKPENFDPSKKYPVIFEIYRQFSNELNGYHTPNWTIDRIDIPYFVSNGYLVFVPDIHYTVPNLKESVLNCVVSAAKYVSGLPFVDAKRMGIQGHSFGGLEIGYVITGTDVFAACSAAAGSYDLISDAGSILPPPSSSSRQGIFEYDFIYGTLCDKKKLYIANSPIFDADKVKTPFLMAAGEKDGQKPYDQNPEYFLGLRRLGKPTWFLSYPEEGHVIVLRHANAIDYSIRVIQFFDHYLKGVPAPVWMTQGIPARLKNVNTGYDLNPSNNCGIDCKVCKYWNERFKKDSAATWREIKTRKAEEHWE